MDAVNSTKSLLLCSLVFGLDVAPVVVVMIGGTNEFFGGWALMFV